ncbi:hypothetical protein R1flu_016769 [Riccia fluitans]|uniref:Uncharacterized protein n=1 Tax=Riccia fluitans TaxID=41844 RepID=A0ABD1YN15_9MARC
MEVRFFPAREMGIAQWTVDRKSCKWVEKEGSRASLGSWSYFANAASRPQQGLPSPLSLAGCQGSNSGLPEVSRPWCLGAICEALGALTCRPLTSPGAVLVCGTAENHTGCIEPMSTFKNVADGETTAALQLQDFELKISDATLSFKGLVSNH